MQIYGDFEDFLQTIVHEVWVVIFHDTWRSREKVWFKDVEDPKHEFSIQ